MAIKLQRCPWAEQTPEYQTYHDEEWGNPVRDDRVLFEFLLLEGAQAGLSWRTILERREGYRKAFADFDPLKVARFDARKQQRLLLDPGIVRNRLKVASAVSNARAFLDVQKSHGSFSLYLWDFVDGTPVLNHHRSMRQVPATTPLSDQISKDLKQRGFRFVGSTIVYAYLQAVGVVNDHLVSCPRHPRLQRPPAR